MKPTAKDVLAHIALEQALDKLRERRRPKKKSKLPMILGGTGALLVISGGGYYFYKRYVSDTEGSLVERLRGEVGARRQGSAPFADNGHAYEDTSSTTTYK